MPYDSIDDPELRARVERLHRESPLTDVHVHVGMIRYLLHKPLWPKTMPRRHQKLLPFGLGSRADFQRLVAGGVRVAWAAHYLPETQLFKDSLGARWAAAVLSPEYPKRPKPSLWDRLMTMVDYVETGARETSADGSRATVVVARTVFELDEALQGPNPADLVILHTLEGVHPLIEGHWEPEPNWEIIDQRIETLKQLGFASVILTHFFQNGVVSNNDAIPPAMHAACGPFHTNPGEHPYLTENGKDLIRRLRRAGMLLDLMHCCRAARGEVIRFICEEFSGWPAIATHIGAQRDLTAVESKKLRAEIGDDDYNLTREEASQIAAIGGLIGVIFYPHWLQTDHKDCSVQLAVDHLRRLAEWCGGWDHLAIGTDLDGFIDAFDEVRDCSEMPTFTARLIDSLKLSDEDLVKVLGGNARRVLNHWIGASQ